MGILDRMTRLIRANVNDMIDHAEDPEKMLDQLIREMNDQIHMARGQVAAMIAQEKELQMDYDQSSRMARDWERKAELAVTQGKDDLAREALRRKRDNEDHAQVYATNLQSQQEMVGKLKTQLQMLEAKYESARANRDVLIARQRRAEAVQKVSSTMSGLKSLEPSAELERMERRIRSNEARALAEQDLAEGSFAAQFAELDGGLEVEDDLQKLKARVSGGQQALPAGESMDELSALKARMGAHEGAALPAGASNEQRATSNEQVGAETPPQTPPPGRQQ